MNPTEKDITKIVSIGRRGMCTKEELLFFVPRLPQIRGDEALIRIGSMVLKKWNERDLDNFIKGLHLIENAYKDAVKNTFGFGSPTPTSKILARLKKEDPQLTEKLTNWIAENGGNYYIKAKDPKRKRQEGLFDED